MCIKSKGSHVAAMYQEVVEDFVLQLTVVQVARAVMAGYMKYRRETL